MGTEIQAEKKSSPTDLNSLQTPQKDAKWWFDRWYELDVQRYVLNRAISIDKTKHDLTVTGAHFDEKLGVGVTAYKNNLGQTMYNVARHRPNPGEDFHGENMMGPGQKLQDGSVLLQGVGPKGERRAYLISLNPDGSVKGVAKTDYRDFVPQPKAEPVPVSPQLNPVPAPTPSPSPARNSGLVTGYVERHQLPPGVKNQLPTVGTISNRGKTVVTIELPEARVELPNAVGKGAVVISDKVAKLSNGFYGMQYSVYGTETPKAGDTPLQTHTVMYKPGGPNGMYKVGNHRGAPETYHPKSAGQ